MLPTRQGSLRLFRVAGIDVFLHWSWFIAALIEINLRGRAYTGYWWNGLEYLTLFAIVTMHEFGHALACRSVGGHANQIVLWPFGGVAYVDPPQRPGATLWSIAAGPLVNVILFPILSIPAYLTRSVSSDIHTFIVAVWTINFVLLCFNLLPVYPLDGGQILRSLLWFVAGRARSLMIAAVIGFFGVAGLVLLAAAIRDIWLGAIALFVGVQCWKGFQVARAMARLDRAPRHAGFACPACGTAPPQGAYWGCGRCRTLFDTFSTGSVCPKCLAQFASTRCLECGDSNPIEAWAAPPVLAPTT